MCRELILKLDAHAIPVSIPAGVLVMRCGEPISNLFLLRRGKMAVFWTDPCQSEPIETRGPSEIVGLPMAPDGTCRITAYTLEDCEVGLLPAGRVLQLLERDFSLWSAVMVYIGREAARMRSVATACCPPAIHRFPGLSEN